MERQPLEVEVVSATRVVWSGTAINVIARTVEGDIGILPGHEPLFALLVPGVVEVVTADGRSESIAVDGGFISVAHGHVSILSQVILLGHEVGLEEAHREAAGIATKAYQGQADDQELHRLRILKAQIRAGEAAAKQAAS
ncbi:MAG: F0F1 ATP synthase subunit epsilon [Tessaracoccus sp.]|uniref:F0F1 ATP synthase subunit epsilon n=1 Tax=Tessaracoccus sp. TaxID=1971211 RepID=UPI001EB5329A|nr:F0F1 ATP synthase subunit epsilon [Tessaracoccus sp.]MBK7821282.1 F0F1 ATP synthase subunit epsilon [Tessaracoccus sp.]